jgi:hypothetical protein
LWRRPRPKLGCGAKERSIKLLCYVTSAGVKHEVYDGVTKSFRTESFPKYTFTTINTRWEAARRVMAPKLTRLTHKIVIQLHLVSESCNICSSRSRRPVRKLLETPSYTVERSLYFKVRNIVSFSGSPEENCIKLQSEF